MPENSQPPCPAEQEGHHKFPYLITVMQADKTVYDKCSMCGWITFADALTTVQQEAWDSEAKDCVQHCKTSIKDEREACARVAEDYSRAEHCGDQCIQEAMDAIATAIRARS